jgi:hypothetical protein
MGEAFDVRTAHTADVDATTLAAARSLLYEVFDDMAEDDWEHCLGGIHALALEDGAVVGTRPWCSGGCSMTVVHCAQATSRASPCGPTGGGAASARR